MASNPIRTKDTLPLNLPAWINSYKTLSNWPVERWLQFQCLERGRLQDALVLLHDFQKEVNVVDTTIQKTMLHWLDSAAAWNRESLSSWKEWDALLKATPHWSLPIQAQVMAQHFQKSSSVSPETFEDIAKVEDHLGRYWNQVQSRISVRPDARWRNQKHDQWTTYSTFRRELKNECLLDHPNSTRWLDFTRLSRAPDSWRAVLTPLYKSWLQDLPSAATIANTNFQSWIDMLDSNNLDPSQMALPSFESPVDYYCCVVPSSWKNNTAENAFEKVCYMDKAMRLFLGDDLGQPEYPLSVLLWMHEQFLQFSNEWSLDKRTQLNDLFLSSLTCYGSSFMSTIRTRDNLHNVFLTWMPEYMQHFTSLRESMDVLGIDYTVSSTDWRGHVEQTYTRASAEKEIVHYVEMLHNLLDPNAGELQATMGHLFESDDGFF